MVYLLISGAVTSASAQQFNTDNYWTAPEGTETSTLTIGEEYSVLMFTAALLPQWEFNLGATLFKDEPRLNSSGHYSITAYVKYMVYENALQTGGVGIMAGTGVVPGYFQQGTVIPDSKSYWVSVPITFPFFDNTLSWDIMPGVTYNKLDDENISTGYDSGFTYSSRLAIYKVIPQSAIVGEVFGTEGQAYSDPKYRVGVRWESKHVIAAFTYGDTFDAGLGAGFEFGVMILSPQFLCFGECGK
jgi:hypothetical protein